MQTKLNLLVAGMFLAATSSALATVRYVNVNNANPTPPYTNWVTAATNIQHAVDAAGAGDAIVVTNGTYAGGSRMDTNGGPNCLLVDKPLVLSSVNGPGVTVINGSGAVRCLYLTNGAVLAGFTLTNGWAAGNGGGVYCESTSAVLTNCVLTGNSAYYGGGAYGGTLNNCTLAGNSALHIWLPWPWPLPPIGMPGRPLVVGRLIFGDGGGAYYGTLNNCTLTGNSARYGGGAADSTLNNSAVSGNTGGGAYEGTLRNCTVTGNSGWGTSSATLNNCIVYFNLDPNGGNYDPSSTLNYCCTTPLPTNGVGNISADPQLASASHLSAESPCIGAGSAMYASGTDIDGEAWANPPSIGCDEYHAGAVTGPLTVSLTATPTNVVIGHPVGLTAFLAGRTDLSVWEFGDGFVQVNEPYTSHTWTAPGDYLVALWVFNESYPGGVSATLTIHVEEGVHYVAATNGNPVAPYTSWATAATNIQDAVDVALPGATIFVTNGTYAAGGRTTPARWDGVTNRVAVDKPLTVRSVNGPEVTVIQGKMPGATNDCIRCVYLTNAATLVGFTLTNGVAIMQYGGGVYCEYSAVLSNCALAGNSAYLDGGGASGGTLYNCTLSGNSARDGGGAAYATLNNCTVTGNSAYWGGWVYESTLNNCTLTANSAYEGGGAYFFCTLNNCTLTANSATGYNGSGGGGAYGCALNNCTLTANSATGVHSGGGGAYSGTLNNCIIYYNSAPSEPNYYDATLNYCCTTPPPAGPGNFTNGPLFVDYAGGNLRLQSNSPCINSGNNAYAPGPTDLDGNPRIAGGTVDIGAYEFQGIGSVISYAWLQQYGLPTDGSADFIDSDGDGLNNWQEWRCGTCPTNCLSALRLLAALPTGTNLTVRWQSVAGVNYFLERSANLGSPFTLLATGIPGEVGITAYADTNATGPGPLFYRVGVGN